MITQEDREFVNFLFGKLVSNVDMEMVDLHVDDTAGIDALEFEQLSLIWPMLSNKSIQQLSNHLYYPVVKAVATDDKFLDTAQELIIEKLGEQVGAMDEDERATIAITILERMLGEMYWCLPGLLWTIIGLPILKLISLYML